MRHPKCPNCGWEFAPHGGRLFAPYPMSRLQTDYLQRRVVPCPECSVPVIWEKRWFRVFVAGLLLTFGVFPVSFVVTRFTVQVWAPIEIVMKSSFVVGIVLFASGGLFSRLVRYDD